MVDVGAQLTSRFQGRDDPQEEMLDGALVTEEGLVEVLEQIFNLVEGERNVDDSWGIVVPPSTGSSGHVRSIGTSSPTADLPSGEHKYIRDFGRLSAAQKVKGMTAANRKWTSLHDLALGDMVTTPEGRSSSVRLLAAFPEGVTRPWRNGGFVILGDFDAILVTGRSTSAIAAYVPIESIPAQVAGRDLLAEGTAGFLAPHLPTDCSALEPVSWRAYRMAGQLEPLLVIYRGPQILAFLPATSYDCAEVSVICLPRSGSTVKPVNRHAVLVDLPTAPVESIPSIRTRPSSRRPARSKR